MLVTEEFGHLVNRLMYKGSLDRLSAEVIAREIMDLRKEIANLTEKIKCQKS